MSEFEHSPPVAATDLPLVNPQEKTAAIDKAVNYFDVSRRKADYSFYNDSFYSAITKKCTPALLNEFEANLETLIQGILHEEDPGQLLEHLTRLVHVGWEYHGWEEARKMVMDRSTVLIGKISDQIPLRKDPKTCFDFLIELRKQNPQTKSEVQAALSKNTDVALRDIALESMDWIRTGAYFMEYADEPSSHRISTALQGSIVNKDNIMTDLFISILCSIPENQTQDRAWEYLSELLKKYQLDIFRVLPIWRDNVGSEQQDIEGYIYSNLSVLRKLMAFAPNAPSYLQKQYGIFNFGRYPVEVLKQMYDEAKNPRSRDYVLALYPRADWNGSFYENQKNLRIFSNQLSTHGYTLKIIECGNLEDIIVRTATLKNQFGQASGALIAGHGSIKTIQLDKYHHVGAQELFQKREGKIIRWGIRRMFKGKPSFVFISCSVGKYRAIGQKISQNYDIRVIACNTDTSIESLSAHVDAGQLVLDATYGSGRKKVFTSGQSVGSSRGRET